MSSESFHSGMALPVSRAAPPGGAAVLQVSEGVTSPAPDSQR
jgi:hypothetical protein